LTPETIIRRLATGVAPEGRLAGPPLEEAAIVPAAVLVALVDHPSGMTVVLTRRTAHLAHHPGQISFPGGRLEPEDGGDVVACALRETHEEVGLSPARVQVLGRLAPLATGTGFRIDPVVGFVRPPVAFIPDPFEVADVIELPLSFVLDPANHQNLVVEREGRRWSGWQLVWGEVVIWGATAAMLVTLSEVLSDAAG